MLNLKTPIKSTGLTGYDLLAAGTTILIAGAQILGIIFGTKGNNARAEHFQKTYSNVTQPTTPPKAE